MKTENAISTILRTKRKERKISQIELATAVGISRSHLAMIETGGDLPGRETLVALFNALDISLDLLAGQPSVANSKAADEEEALWLHGWRAMDASERKQLLAYVLSRAKPKSN
jgi:transcriptional regulator with XRE-family HTH domain